MTSARRFAVFLLLAMAALPPGARSQTPVRVVTENLAPFSHVEDGRVVGLSTALVTAMFERAGRSLRIDVLPWTRAVETVRQSPDVLIYSMTRTPEREPDYAWVAPLVPLGLTIYRLRDRPELAAGSFEEVRAKGRVVVIANDASIQQLREHGFQDEHLFVLADAATGQRTTPVVLNRRAEYLVSNPFTIAYRIRQGQLEDAFERVVDLPRSRFLYLAAHPQADAGLLDGLRGAFAQMEADGTVASIRRAFGD